MATSIRTCGRSRSCPRWSGRDPRPEVADAEESLDVEQAVIRLNDALKLQYRSVHQYTLSSGSLFGFEYQSLGDRLWEYAKAELADTRKLVEKVVALGGEPTTEPAASPGGASPTPP